MTATRRHLPTWHVHITQNRPTGTDEHSETIKAATLQDLQHQLSVRYGELVVGPISTEDAPDTLQLAFERQVVCHCCGVPHIVGTWATIGRLPTYPRPDASQ